MKSIAIIISLFLASLTCIASIYPVYDTVVNPPETPLDINGVVNCCMGETTTYFVDIPIGCNPNWYINGELYDNISEPLSITWYDSGIMELWVCLNCNSLTICPDTLNIIVSPLPTQPGTIQGANNTCINLTEIYTTTVNNNENCQWVVDGIIQPSDSAIMSFYWASAGDHLIEVNAINDCGQSVEQSLDITVFKHPVVNLGNDTSIFIGQTLLLDAGNPGSVFLWSTGDTTQTITVTQTGYYSVIAENPCGFDSDDIYVDVVVGFPENDLNEIGIIIQDGFLVVKCNDLDIRNIAIYNNSGHGIHKSQYLNRYRLPAKGIYVIMISTGTTIMYKRIIYSGI